MSYHEELKGMELNFFSISPFFTGYAPSINEYIINLAEIYREADDASFQLIVI